jgi:hypothetical protein
MGMDLVKKMKELIKEYWENDNVRNIASILACVLSVVAICVALNSNNISMKSNTTAFEAKSLSAQNDGGEQRGIIVVNNSVITRKTARTYCEQYQDIMCLYNLLMNNGDELDRTIELLLPIEIANPRQSAIFSVTITNVGLDEQFFKDNWEIIEANDKLKWKIEDRGSWNIDERSSLLNLVLYGEETGETYKAGFAKYRYAMSVPYVGDMVIELPYIDVRYQKISGEDIMILKIDRGYFDLAFLTATYNNDDSNSEMSTSSQITIPLHYSYLDYNNVRYKGEIEIIITVSVNHEYQLYNEYEFIIEMEYINVTKWTEICKK